MRKQLYEFTCQKVVLNDNTTYYIPFVRVRRGWLMQVVFPHPWNRIACMYDRYVLAHPPFEPMLTAEQCAEHIAGYKQVLRTEASKNICTEQYSANEEIEF